MKNPRQSQGTTGRNAPTVPHEPTDVWQERPGEFSYRCSCGMHMKHQRFGDWPKCPDAHA